MRVCLELAIILPHQVLADFSRGTTRGCVQSEYKRFPAFLIIFSNSRWRPIWSLTYSQTAEVVCINWLNVAQLSFVIHNLN